MSWTRVAVDFSVYQRIADGFEEVLNLFEAVTSISELIADLRARIASGLQAGDLRRDALVLPVLDALKAVSASTVGIDTGLMETGINETGLTAALLPMPLVDTGWRAQQAPGVRVSELSDLAVSGAVAYPSEELEGSGGNYGFYRTALEALLDEGDPSRPRLDPDAHTAMVVVLYGASTYARAFDIARAVEVLVGPQSHASLTGVELPVPRDVKAVPVAPTSLTSARLQRVTDVPAGVVRLQWPQRPTLKRSRAFKGVAWRAKSARVYLKEGSKIRPGEDLSAYLVEDVELPELDPGIYGLTLQGRDDHYELRGLEEDVDYFASVAYVYELDEGGATSTVEPTHAELSSQVRVNLTDRPPPTQFARGVSPDWISLRDVSGLVPGLRDASARAITRAQRRVEGLRGLSDPYAEAFDLAGERVASTIEEVLEQLNTLREQLAIVEDLNATLNLPTDLNATLTPPTDRVGVRVSDLDVEAGVEAGLWFGVRVGQGNEVWYARQLADLLLNEALEDRPAFDTGDEVVGGFVLLAQARAPGPVNAWVEALRRIFSGAGLLSPETRAILDLDNPSSGSRPVEPFPGQGGSAAPSVDAPSLGLTPDDPCGD